MLALLTALTDQLAAIAPTTVSLVPNAVPNPGSGEAPPGAEKFLTIVRWGAWLATGVCVLAAIVVGARMAIGSNQGRGGQHGTDLGWVLAGSIVVGAAAGIVGALV